MVDKMQETEPLSSQRWLSGSEATVYKISTTEPLTRCWLSSSGSVAYPFRKKTSEPLHPFSNYMCHRKQRSHSVSTDWVAQWFILYKRTNIYILKYIYKYLWAQLVLPPITFSGVDQAPDQRLAGCFSLCSISFQDLRFSHVGTLHLLACFPFS